MIHKKLIRQFIPHVHQNGQHHRAHSLSHFGLLIYLQILLVLVGGFYFIRISAPHILGTASFGADQIIAITNEKRAENGLAPLSSNGQLASAASAKAADMFANNYWAHNSPQGKTPWSFIGAAGYRYIFAGENLARDFNDPGSVVNAWMNSPSHRSNLLDKNFKEIGVAVSSGSLDGREGILVVQMFGSAVSSAPIGPLAAASPVPTSAPETKASPSPAVANAQTSPTPEPSPSIEPTPSPPTAIAEVPSVPSEQPVTVLASRQFSLAKGAAFGVVGLVFILFTIEAVVATRSAHLTIRRGLIAHLALLGFVLLAVWYAVQGAIL